VPAPADAAALWSLVDAGAFDARIWADGAVVYVAATGETHALTAAAGAVLQRMRECGVRSGSVSDWLLALDPDEGEGEDRAQAEPDPLPQADVDLLARVFEGLQRIGLLQQCRAS
jgi:hypothetical protein